MIIDCHPDRPSGLYGTCRAHGIQRNASLNVLGALCTSWARYAPSWPRLSTGRALLAMPWQPRYGCGASAPDDARSSRRTTAGVPCASAAAVEIGRQRARGRGARVGFLVTKKVVVVE